MIALLLALQAAPAPSLPDALPRQALPASGCAAFLWSRDDRRLVAMAIADPAGLRLSFGGKPADYPRTTQVGVGGFGFAGTTGYRLGATTATLDLTIAARGDLADGAAVPEATLTIARDGADTLVLPVAGLIGCAPKR
jgi:hypothetical protein